ncbi:MAG: hypothetical protein ACQKBW_08735 [Puniceicoccales bacterium]
MPQVRKAAVAGSVAWGARKAIPMLKPLAFGLLHKTLSGRSGKRILKIGGLVAAGLGAWKLFGPDDED